MRRVGRPGAHRQRADRLGQQRQRGQAGAEVAHEARERAADGRDVQQRGRLAAAACRPSRARAREAGAGRRGAGLPPGRCAALQLPAGLPLRSRAAAPEAGAGGWRSCRRPASNCVRAFLNKRPALPAHVCAVQGPERPAKSRNCSGLAGSTLGGRATRAAQTAATRLDQRACRPAARPACTRLTDDRPRERPSGACAPPSPADSTGAMEQRLRNSLPITACRLSCGRRLTSGLGGRPAAAASSRRPRIV